MSVCHGPLDSLKGIENIFDSLLGKSVMCVSNVSLLFCLEGVMDLPKEGADNGGSP